MLIIGLRTLEYSWGMFKTRKKYKYFERLAFNILNIKKTYIQIIS